MQAQAPEVPLIEVPRSVEELGVVLGILNRGRAFYEMILYWDQHDLDTMKKVKSLELPLRREYHTMTQTIGAKADLPSDVSHNVTQLLRLFGAQPNIAVEMPS